MWSRMIRGTCCLAILLYCRSALSADTATTLPEFFAADSSGYELECLAASLSNPSYVAMRNRMDANGFGQTSVSGPIEHSSDSNMDDSECCGLASCCNVCPCTYGWADGLILWRENRGSNRPLVLNLNTGDPL